MRSVVRGQARTLPQRTACPIDPARPCASHARTLACPAPRIPPAPLRPRALGHCTLQPCALRPCNLVETACVSVGVAPGSACGPAAVTHDERWHHHPHGSMSYCNRRGARSESGYGAGDAREQPFAGAFPPRDGRC